MGRLKHTLLFYGLSISAYTSPIVLIVSMLTNYWLFSVERITHHPHGTSATTVLLNTRTSTTSHHTIQTHENSSKVESTSPVEEVTTTKYYEPLPQIEASYGLWEICKISGNFRKEVDNF